MLLESWTEKWWYERVLWGNSNSLKLIDIIETYQKRLTKIIWREDNLTWRRKKKIKRNWKTIIRENWSKPKTCRIIGKNNKRFKKRNIKFKWGDKIRKLKP